MLKFGTHKVNRICLSHVLLHSIDWIHELWGLRSQSQIHNDIFCLQIKSKFWTQYLLILNFFFPREIIRPFCHWVIPSLIIEVGTFFGKIYFDYVIAFWWNYWIIWGHVQTTWTEFWAILTPPSPNMNTFTE